MRCYSLALLSISPSVGSISTKITPPAEGCTPAFFYILGRGGGLIRY